VEDDAAEAAGLDADAGALVGVEVRVPLAEAGVAGVAVAGVLELPMAFAWKVAKLLPGLMAKTMPCLQWFPWRQKTQTGFSSCTMN